MIHETTYTKEWILRKSNEYKRGRKKADPTLIEKVTKALHLVEELAQTGLKFIFKGGTSLLLLLDQMHRFSIDIDIIIEKQMHEADLDKIINQIVDRSSVFLRYEESVRSGTSEVPKAHYKILYRSVLYDEEHYILLDVLFGESQYAEVIEKSLDCSFAAYSEPSVLVSLPSIDSILGDKLTAYAPNTTGIPYGKNKELEIIKQLFDVGNLFDEIRDIKMVSKTFKKTAEQELVYRSREHELSYEDVLDDIFHTSRIVSERGRVQKDIYDQLLIGVKRIKDYIFSRNFILESAVNSASKAAYLSLLIKHGITDIERFDSSINLRDYPIIQPDFRKFNTIMKFDPEAYFYWFKSIEIIISKKY